MTQFHHHVTDWSEGHPTEEERDSYAHRMAVDDKRVADDQFANIARHLPGCPTCNEDVEKRKDRYIGNLDKEKVERRP